MIHNNRFRNTTDLRKYILRDFVLDESESLSIQGEMSKTMFLELRMIQRVRRSKFYLKYGMKIEEAYPGVIEHWVKDGYLMDRDGYIACTKKGIKICNQIMIDFL